MPKHYLQYRASEASEETADLELIPEVAPYSESDLAFENRKTLVPLMFIIMWLLTAWVALKKLLIGEKLHVNSFWFDGISYECRQVKESAFSWKALEVVYNMRPKTGIKSLGDKITLFWNEMLNAQSVRNRLKLAKRLLRIEFEKKLDAEGQLRVLSIASGSARGVLEVFADMKNEGFDMTKVKGILVDLDQSAIVFSKNLALELGVSESMEYVNESASRIEEISAKFKPNVVEMIGFLEYRPLKRALALLKRIHRLLSTGGVLIVSQIAPNYEMYFMKVVVDWPMIYRKPFEFSQLLIESGFSPLHCRLVYEPLGLHGIAVCGKEEEK